jgi:hypothetical protein
VRNWVNWHHDYDRPGSSLSRRLKVVHSRLSDALDLVGSEPVVLSLCAGDGRDIIPLLRDQPGRVGRVVLVELDRTLAERGRLAARAAGLTVVEVRCADAGAVDSFTDVLPVDILMLCGIFGNIDHTQVKNIIEVSPCLMRWGGCVIWTRGGSEPDRRPEARRWFTEAGFEELAFDGDPEPYGVGLSRMMRSNPPVQGMPPRLFRFT